MLQTYNIHRIPNGIKSFYVDILTVNPYPIYTIIFYYETMDTTTVVIM